MASSTRDLPRGGRLPAPFNQISGPQWLVLLVVLLGMALVGREIVRRTVGDGTTEEVAYQTGTVTRRTIDSTVSATGAVSATRQVRVTFPSAGQVEEVLVKQGDTVQESQPLARLNTFPLEVKRDQARSNLATAQFRLDALLAGPVPADIAAAQQTVATAQSTLTRAQNDLFNLLAGANPDEVAAARTAVERAQANLTTAQTNWDRLASGTDLTLRPEYATLQQARSTYQQALTNYVNKTAPPNSFEVSTAQATLSSAHSSLNSARARLNQVLAGPDPLDVANAQNQVTAAQAALTAAKAKLAEAQSPVQQTSVSMAALEAAVDSARQDLRAAEVRETDALFSGSEVERASAKAGVVAAQAKLLSAQNNLNNAALSSQPNSAEVTSAQQGVTTAETNLAKAQNDLAKVRQPPPPADIASAQQAVAAAESQVQTAQNNLDKLLAGPPAEEVAATKAALDTATSTLETAQTNWDRLANGVDLETRPEYTQLIAARSEYQTAVANYNLKTQGPKPGDIEALQATVDAANATLSSALARLAQVQGGSLPTDIGVAREAVTNAELALRQMQFDLDNATIRAPFKGTVASVGVNPGDQVSGTTAAFTLLDPDLVKIDASVDEANVIKLRPQMPVIVTFDALQGRQFQGTIASVTPAGAAQQGVVTYPVVVVFNSQGFTIPPGATANLRIVTESRPNVLTVPSRAIARTGGQTTVDVLVDGRPEPRPVQTGIAGDNFTEILEGLQDGETIVVSTPQRAGQAGTGAFGAGGLPGLGAGGPAPAAPAQPARR